jgi:hypothetical protein
MKFEEFFHGPHLATTTPLKKIFRTKILNYCTIEYIVSDFQLTCRRLCYEKLQIFCK